MTAQFVLLLVALILFIFAAVGVAVPRGNMVAAGLAFATAAFLLA